MKKINQILKALFTLVFFAFVSCEKTSYEFGDIVVPNNFSIQAEIVGADNANPNGDGSGVVNFKAKADNAITYKYVFEGKEKMAPSGDLTISFSKTGTFKYNVTVIAYGAAGSSSSAVHEVEVKVVYVPPADLITMLTNNSSRTWRIKNESSGHFGVGPADGDAPIWWAANPNDKDGLGAYDDRIVFNVDGTVNYKTNGTLYGKADPITIDFGDFGATANGDNEFVNHPVNDFNDTWTITAPGGKETLSFAKFGYHGFYVGGDHSYTILARSANEISIKTIGSDGLGWFGILVAVD